MNYSSRFFLYAPVAAFLALAVLAMGYWWASAGAIKQRLAAVKGHEAVPGITLDWSRAALSGFPFRIDIVFDNFSVRGAGAHGHFAWQSEQFAVHALTYGAQKDVFEAAGTQRLSWMDAHGGAHATSFVPGALRASAVRDRRGLIRADLEIIGAQGSDFTAGRLQFHMRRDPDGRDIDLMAQTVALHAPALKLRTMSAYLTLKNAAPLTALLRGEKSWDAASAQWRAQGGQAMTTKTDGITPQDAVRLLNPLY